MKLSVRLFALFYLAVFLAACGTGSPPVGTPTASPERTATATPPSDPCSEENLPAEVAKVNKLMREFDDYSALASNTPQAQLVVVIPELQRILREAEDQQAPVCLQTLKKYQIEHMTIVIQTLMAFMSNADSGLVNTGIMRARELRLQYDVEVARLLGITMAVAPTPAAPPTSAADASTPSSAEASSPIAFNPGPNGVYIRSEPDFSAAQVGVLAVQASARAFGRTADSQWVLIEIPDLPGQNAWVYAALVQVSIPIEQLPVASP